MINYSEVHYDWLKISILGGFALSIFILILAIWGFNPLTILTKSDLWKARPLEKEQPTPTASVSPNLAPSAVTTTPTNSSVSSRDIFNPAKEAGARRDLTMPSPTPLITLPYSSTCPTNAIIYDSKRNPEGCLVRPKF